jgi:ribosomal protein S18 acetylase RimI-like enzyme
MLIRPATQNDVPAVLPMVAKICALHETWDAAKYGFLTHPEQRYEKWLKGAAIQERAVFLVAEDEEQLIGFIIATVEKEIPIYRLKEYAFIHDLWVEPEYRHQGVARQMVMQAVESFHSLGVKQVRLDTAPVNETA